MKRSNKKSSAEDVRLRVDKRNFSGYGFELLMDLHGCDTTLFNRAHIDSFFSKVCELIDMDKCEVHFWDDLGVPESEQQTLPHTKGTSAVCFILTSTIVVHSLDLLGAVYVNIFSCKQFDAEAAVSFTSNWFKAESYRETLVERTLGDGMGGE